MTSFARKVTEKAVNMARRRRLSLANSDTNDVEMLDGEGLDEHYDAHTSKRVCPTNFQKFLFGIFFDGKCQSKGMFLTLQHFLCLKDF